MGRRKVELPGDVAALQEKLSAWRLSKDSSTTRMPTALWDEAVRVAGRAGTSFVSRVLGLSYLELRRRVGELREATMEPEIRGGDFVELGTWAGGSPLRMEVQLANGALMRIEGLGGSTHDAAALLRVFLGEG